MKGNVLDIILRELGRKWQVDMINIIIYTQIMLTRIAKCYY